MSSTARDPMPAPTHPPSASPSPLAWWLATLPARGTWGEVLILRHDATHPAAAGRFELRHVRDESTDPAGLRSVAVHDLRTLAASDAAGRFRPLRSVPNLVDGWRCPVATARELDQAMDHLYPGTVADAWAAHQGHPGMRFEEVAARQVGRAGALRQLTGTTLAPLVAAACTPVSCLKTRLWTAEGLPPADSPNPAATRIPCLEPCPLFLGFARACAATEAGSTVPSHFAPDDLATLAAALRHALEHRPVDLRLGEVTAPLHPWRVARLLARHADTWSRAASPTEASDE